MLIVYSMANERNTNLIGVNTSTVSQSYTYAHVSML